VEQISVQRKSKLIMPNYVSQVIYNRHKFLNQNICKVLFKNEIDFARKDKAKIALLGIDVNVLKKKLSGGLFFALY
jgi:adenylate cyclase